jgi:hypothetical protein
MSRRRSPDPSPACAAACRRAGRDGSPRGETPRDTAAEFWAPEPHFPRLTTGSVQVSSKTGQLHPLSVADSCGGLACISTSLARKARIRRGAFVLPTVPACATRMPTQGQPIAVALEGRDRLGPRDCPADHWTAGPPWLPGWLRSWSAQAAGFDAGTARNGAARVQQIGRPWWAPTAFHGRLWACRCSPNDLHYRGFTRPPGNPRRQREPGRPSLRVKCSTN